MPDDILLSQTQNTASHAAAPASDTVPVKTLAELPKAASINDSDIFLVQNSTTTQYGQISQLLEKFSDRIMQQTLNRFHPVGSLYLTVTNTNPGTLLGGTWERYGNGKVLMGVDENQTEFNTPAKTGGAKTVSLSHSHTVTSHAHSVGGHAHSINGHSHTVNNHGHSMGSHSHTVNNHTHYVQGHSHTVNSHKHLQTMGSNSSYFYFRCDAPNGQLNQNGTVGYWDVKSAASRAGAFDYTSSVAPGTSATALNTDGSAPGTSAFSGNTGNTAPGTNSVGLTTNNSTAFNTGSSAPGTNSQLSAAQSILPPYQTCYIWKRKA
ncbi:phage baseplate protein [Murimonas intestini]|uniref:Baseplate structural protein Gp10 C-terminal domain-containing protein n=1 Tax=Murimonas intestini TaxID=1337051 RepID=A0AB73T1K0_9FIRM|nr:hypothetical protein [Murimonas intestini]MCR1842502.1 hypothetical protein [Murimonas intestini]MCR1867140.1 hypothetical protein [Murimonas intestini]MCR1884326.1 hypothetical protein [Murimonas intestini]